MSTTASTITRPSGPGTTVSDQVLRTIDLADPTADLPDGAEAPESLADISCWRLLTARVPLTLLLDLAMPSAEELAELYEEMLAEPSPIDWLPRQRA